MKQILIIILFISISNRIIAQNDILYSFQDEKTEFIGFKDKNGEIKIEAKFSILTGGKFINIIPVTEYTTQGTESYYLLKNGKKVGYDSLWVYDITYDCEKEGFIRYRDEKRKIGLFDKNGQVTVPSEYMYLSQVQNSVIKAMKNGKNYLIDTTNHILIKNFDENRYIDYFSLEIEEKPSSELFKRSYLGENGKYYNFVDNYKLFEDWFLNSFIKNLDKKYLINNTYNKPIYWTDDKGWSTKNSQDFINDNYEVLKERFLQFSGKGIDYFITDENAIICSNDRYNEFNKYRDNCGNLEVSKYPLMEVIVNLSTRGQNHYTFLKTESGFKLLNISLKDGKLE